jgi:PAS domain S-box-containing protein
MNTTKDESMQDNFFTRFLIVFLFLFSGVLVGILLGPRLNSESINVLLGIGILLIVFGIYSAVRIYVVTQSKSLKTAEYTGKKSEVGFVVDTFQELVAKLKEKERELDRLKALAEDRAAGLETYNENILQSVPSGVVSIDNSMKIKSINQSAAKILGIKAEDALNKDCSEIFDEPLLGIMKDCRTINRGEYPYVTRDNRHSWLGVTSSQLRNAANEAIGLILVFTDLTDVKALQMQVELKKRLTQLGEMSAGIAHEIRNPLSVITGYVKLLDKKVEAQNKTALAGILTETNNIERIISELLAFAKPTALNRVSVKLNRVIEEAVATAVGDNEKLKISIKAENDVSVMADEILLRQVLTNLFTNAVEAMPDGGNLDIELNRLHDRIGINIKDTGSGIPENIKQKIFFPFYTTKQKGIGLGLAIVQKIIVSHGGSIKFDSKEGEGTTFTIILPMES